MIDHFEKVTDRDAAIYTREIVKQEGIWVGNSAGSAIAGMLQQRDRFREGETVVVIFHDHGTRYVGKMFNPDWMRMMGYEPLPGAGTARSLVKNKKVTEVVGVEETDSVEHAVARMRENDFSQIPVLREGASSARSARRTSTPRWSRTPSIRTEPVRSIMQKPFRYVDIETPISLLAPMITPQHPAVLVRDFPADKTYILTGYDVLAAL